MFEPDYSTALAWPWLHAKRHLSIELHQGKSSTYICPIFVQNRPRRCEKVGQVHVRSGAWGGEQQQWCELAAGTSLASQHIESKYRGNSDVGKDDQ